jgi:putative hydrolase of the HAD superfamily
MRRSLQLVLDALRSALADAGQDPAIANVLDVDELKAIRDRVAEEWRGQCVSHEIIRLEAFRRSLDRIGYPNDALTCRLNNLYMRHRFSDIETYADVPPILDQLRGAYRLGIISNGNSYPDQCGLAGYFEFTLFSQDHGVAKPDPRLFHLAMAEVDCRPEEMLHVGDSCETDVRGANHAGVYSVWLNRGARPHRESIRPKAEITSLSQLPTLITQLSIDHQGTG